MSTHFQRTCRRGLALSVAAISFSLLLPFCSSLNIFPVSEDKQLGAQFAADILKDPKTYPILNNVGAKSYVQSIVNKIKMAPEVQYENTFPYVVEIINDDKTVNAFCTPGGYIYVYTGLIKMLDNEAALAGVLGHEIAHAERRHSTSRMTKAMGVQALLDMLSNKTSDRTINFAANAVAGMGLLKNSRDDEDEADDYSFKYLRSTQWYPGGIMYFFEKVKGRGGSALEELFSTHPMPQSRLDNTIARLKEANIPPPTEAQLNARGYEEFRRKLK
ncbi:MAG: M48 family metalloprotease [Bradyrhizobiaceae bacterium]|nr:M48 family metalloprotease [Bradyrhizobiaceae bacterium]